MPMSNPQNEIPDMAGMFGIGGWDAQEEKPSLDTPDDVYNLTLRNYGERFGEKLARRAKAIAERVLPISMNPFVRRDKGDFGSMVAWVLIPADDVETRRLVDEIAATTSQELDDWGQDDTDVRWEWIDEL